MTGGGPNTHGVYFRERFFFPRIPMTDIPTTLNLCLQMEMRKLQIGLMLLLFDCIKHVFFHINFKIKQKLHLRDFHGPDCENER